MCEYGFPSQKKVNIMRDGVNLTCLSEPVTVGAYQI